MSKQTYKFEKSDLERLYLKQKLTTTEIGEIFGCHKDTVLYWLKKYNIPRRKERKLKRIDDQKDWLYQKYVVEKLSSRDIAEILNIDKDTVLYRLKRCGITPRERLESLKGIWSKKQHPHLGKKGELSYNFGRTLSKEAKKKISVANSGPNNPQWSGGVTKNADGYILRKAPNHPYADQHGYVLEHRLVMEEILGRYLEPGEVVHHINGNKSDNRPENLMIFNSKRDHVKYHSYFKEKGEKNV